MDQVIIHCIKDGEGVLENVPQKATEHFSQQVLTSTRTKDPWTKAKRNTLAGIQQSRQYLCGGQWNHGPLL